MSPRTPLVFVVLAASLHLVGVGLGLHMGAAGDFTLRPVHAHLNVLGWTSLGLYGVAWAVWPALGGLAARRIHLALSGTSAVLLPAGLFLKLEGGSPALLVAGSLGWAAGAVWFLALAARLCLRLQTGDRAGGAPEPGQKEDRS